MCVVCGVNANMELGPHELTAVFWGQRLPLLPPICWQTLMIACAITSPRIDFWRHARNLDMIYTLGLPGIDQSEAIIHVYDQ